MSVQKQRYRKIIFSIATVFIILGIVIAILNTVGAIQGYWASILSFIIGGLSLIVGIYPLFFPGSGSIGKPLYKSQSSIEIPALIIEADKDISGLAYLLSSDIYSRSITKENNPATERLYIGQQNFNGQPIYGAVFQDLIPNEQYMFWIDGSEPMPLTLSYD